MVTEVDNYLKLKFHAKEPKVVLSVLVNQDGTSPLLTENKIVITPVAFEQERIQTGSVTYQAAGSQVFEARNVPVHLNVSLLFAANFSGEYLHEALRYLSLVISFFQGKHVFTLSNTPALQGTAIDKLVFELQNLTLQDKSHLWGMLGAKYIPSVLYKMRMVTITQDALVEVVPAITQFAK